MKLNNLHAAIYTSAETRPELSELPMIELVIHRGTAYGRGVHIINEDFSGLKPLKERLEKITVEEKQKETATGSGAGKDSRFLEKSRNCASPDSDTALSQPSINLSCYNSSNERELLQEMDMEVSCDLADQSQPQTSQSHDQINQSNVQQSQTTARCMLQTSTGTI